VLKLLKKLFTPYDMLNSIYDINLDYLRKNNIEAIILDMDNTIIARKDPLPSLNCLNWVDDMKNSGIKICIASNNSNLNRVASVSEYLDLPAVIRSLKPLPFVIRKTVKEILQVSHENVLMVGDQFFSDILGGNILGLKTVHVEPLAPELSTIRKYVIQIDKKIFNFLNNY
jgi:uncharacterized protein